MKTILFYTKGFLFLSVLMFTFNSFSQSTATYNISFTSVWNASDHGTLPSNAHWSHLIGANHVNSNEFLQMGSEASPGVEDVAEIGNNDLFIGEINTSVTQSNSEQLIDMASLSSATGTITISNLEVSDEYPLLTLISMIAPSPDWFIAINSYDLKPGGNWITNEVIDLFPYDAGTENGNGYSINNTATVPQENITSIVNVLPFNNQRIGFITINLVETVGIESETLFKNSKIYPNPSNGLIHFSHLDNNDSYYVKIYNLFGEKLKEVVLNEKGSTNNTVNLSGLSTGVYFAKITSNDFKNTTTKKFVIK